MMLDVVGTVDHLRQLIARAEALATATERLVEHVFHLKDDEERRRMERVVHLISATASAVQGAMEASDRFAAELITGRSEA